MTTLADIAAKIGGAVVGDAGVMITGLASIQKASEGDITFLTQAGYAKLLPGCKASAVIAGKDVPPGVLAGKNAILVDSPALAYVEVAELFEKPPTPTQGVHPAAVVAEGATVAEGASVGPFVYVGPGARIDRGVVIHPFVCVGARAEIGEDCVLHPHVTLYPGVVLGRRVVVHAGAVLGADGFGYTWDGKRHRKIPQLGVLRIGDDVEIGANTTIDRASLDATVIGADVKIDNLVMIAHNVAVGDHSILVSQVGVAGSTTIGQGVILAGKVGVKDHVTIGNNVRAAGGTGITKNVPDNAIIAGTPHMGHREWLRLQGYLRQLPELAERLQRIERHLTEEEHDRDR